MSDFKATPQHWEQVQGWSEDRDISVSCDAACILELRSRIEALEARNKPGFMEMSVTTTSQKPQQDKLDRLIELDREGSLVERVGRLISRTVPTDERFRNEAKAAIREVATWLEEEFGPGVDYITADLREEAQ